MQLVMFRWCVQKQNPEVPRVGAVAWERCHA